MIGAGNRGITTYGRYAETNGDKLDFVAVAEPVQLRREKFARIHGIDEKRCYDSWKDILNEDKLADTCFICTQDQLHTEPALLALEKGYDVLLEKPMAHTLKENVKIVKKVEETNRILGVGHVLRYTKFFSTIHRAIQEGLLGNVVNITHRENVSYFHMAHSFVRGNWGNEEESSPMILAKCCHDLDLLYWLVGSTPKKVSSFGNLLHFKKENAPENTPKYCVEGCPVQDECIYYAPRIYVDIDPILQVGLRSGNRLYKFFANLRRHHVGVLKLLARFIPRFNDLIYWKEWPVEPLYHGHEEDYSDKAKMEILRTSPYGRCVYQCDNDVVDHQLVNIEFENGVTANLSMHGFSDNEGRTIRIDGTKATLIGKFMATGESIELHDHLTGKEELLHEHKLSLNMTTHGGGDSLLIDAFLDSVINRKIKPLTNARASLESHLLAFAAEESRHQHTIIDMKLFRQQAEKM